VERYALIVAGGKGERFGGTLPKQFQELLGVPILIRALKAFQEALRWDGIHLVLHPESFREWERTLRSHPMQDPPELVKGGEERFHSVKNGLKALPDRAKAIVAVHDAVRPLVAPELIGRVMKEAASQGNAVPSIPLRESIRRVAPDGTNQAVDRSGFRAIQTPQCFELNQLKQAMEAPYATTFTDEATVMESYGEAIHLVEGDPVNIKITEQLDMQIGAGLLQER